MPPVPQTASQVRAAIDASNGLRFPVALSGLTNWYAADRITGLADSAPVATWSDLSGNERHAVQATEANQPLYRVAQKDGLPAVWFDGTNDGLAATHPLTGDASLTAFVVASIEGDSLASARQLIGLGTTTTNQGVIVGINTNLYEWAQYSGTSRTLGPTYASFAVVSGRRSPTTLRLAVNGYRTAETTPAALNLISSVFQIGRGPGSFFWRGDVAEVLLYDRVLTDDETRRVEAYLMAKWGVA